jgi:transposase-like protein
MDKEPGRAAPAGKREAVHYSEALAQEICARVSEGESQHELAREEGMPARRTFRDWAQRYPAFGEQLDRAKAAAQVAAWTKSRIAEDAKRWRVSLRATRRGGQPTTLNEAVAEEVLDRIAGGETVLSIGAEPDMPSAATIYKWARQNEAFAKAYVRAKAIAADLMFDMIYDIALEASEETVQADALRIRALRAHAAQIAPRRYGQWLLDRAPPDPFAAPPPPLVI